MAWLAIVLIGLVAWFTVLGPALKRSEAALKAAQRRALLPPGIQVPERTEPPRTVEVPSETDAEQVYTVDLQELSCDCPEWTKRRSGYPVRDVRRIDKHIARALLDRGGSGDPRVDCLIGPMRGKSRLGTKAQDLWSFDVADANVLIATRQGTVWYDVIAQDAAGKWRRYGYNPDEVRWAYGKGPPGAAVIEERVDDFHDQIER